MSDMAAPRLPSLRGRLLRHVMLPLLLTWALGSALAFAVASYFTQRAFDRSMLDDAVLLASHMELRDGELMLNVSTADLNIVLFDQSEKVYFAVQRWDGQLIAGNEGLGATHESDADVEFTDLNYKGQDLRAVVLSRDQPAPLRVVVALTTHSRSELLRKLLLFSAIPQVLLLFGLAVWLRRVISEDTQPLSRLQMEMMQRDAADLSHLPPDISEQAGTRDVQALAAATNGLFERIAQGISAQREFAGTVAHELKTPLAGLRAAAEYGLAQSDPQRWREQLKAVLQSQQRASHLIDQLLALALADEAGAGLALQPIRLDSLVRELLLQHLQRADAAGVDLGASGLDEPVWVLGQQSLIEGLFGNLLDNALRYGCGAKGGSISVDLSEEAGEIWLKVSDQGPGIAASQHEALTQRWRQGEGALSLSKTAGLGEGAGLGLSIVKRYAQLMGARLILASGPGGQGLLAAVVFPHLVLAPTFPPPGNAQGH